MQSIVDDDEATVFQLLQVLPDPVIESLIKGTLPYDYRTSLDMDFRRFIDREMALTSTPGIYLNIPSWGVKKEGKGLSRADWNVALKQIGDYLEDDPAHADQNAEIDNYFNSGTAKDDRRFGRSARAKRIAKEWLQAIERMYLVSYGGDESCIRCPAECGWGGNMLSRASIHSVNAGTLYLFAVYDAVTQRIGFPKPMQLSIFPLWKNDQKLISFAKAAGHILCSTLWFEGGLNSFWPEGMELTQTSEFFLSDESALIAYNQPLGDINFVRNSENLARRRREYSHMYHDNEKYAEFKSLVCARAESEAAEKACQEAKQKYEEALADAKEKQKIAERITKMNEERSKILEERGKAIDQQRSTETTLKARMDDIKARAANAERYKHRRERKPATSPDAASSSGQP